MADPNCPGGVDDPLCFDTRPPPTPAHPRPTPTPDPNYQPSTWHTSAASTYPLSNALGLLNLAVAAFLVLKAFPRTPVAAVLAFLLVGGGFLLSTASVQALLTDGVCDGPVPMCTNPGPPQGPTDPAYSSAPPIHPLDDRLRLPRYTFLAFLALRLFLRSSMRSIAASGLIIGGLIYVATRVQAASTDGGCEGPAHVCLDSGANQQPANIMISVPPGFLLEDASRLLRYIFLDSLALRVFARASMSNIVAFGLIIGGFPYDANRVQAAATAEMSALTPLYDPNTTASATVKPLERFWNCYGTPNCLPNGGETGNSVYLSEAWRVAYLTLTAFVAARVATRRSMSAFFCLVFLVAGFAYQFAKAEATETTTLQSTTLGISNEITSSTTEVTQSLTNALSDAITTSVTAVSRNGDCKRCKHTPGKNAVSKAFAPSDALMALSSAIMAFFVMRSYMRRSASALCCFCLVIGGLVYQTLQVEAAVTPTLASITSTSSSTFDHAIGTTATAIAERMTTFFDEDAITASLMAHGYTQKDCNGVVHCMSKYPHHATASHSASLSKWLAFAIVAGCMLVLVSGQRHGIVPGSVAPQESRVHERADMASSSPTSAASSSFDDKPEFATVHHMVAGRMVSEKKSIKPAGHLERVEDEDTLMDTKGPNVDNEKTVADSQPGYRGLATLAALILIATLFIPMALAESPNRTPAFTPTKDLMVAPLTTELSREVELASRRNDRLHLWTYGSDALRAHPLLVLAPMILVGSFSVPALIVLIASWAVEKGASDTQDLSDETDVKVHSDPEEPEGANTVSIAASTDVVPSTATLSPRMAQTELPPIWITYYSTTTIMLPTVTVTGAPCTEANQALCPILLRGNPWDTPAEATCTEANQAVCPIVLGRKGWMPISAASAKAGLGRTGLTLMSILWFAALSMAQAQAQGDAPIYLPVESAAAGELVGRSRTLYRNGSVIGAGTSDLAGVGWAVVSSACAAGVAVVVGFFV
ncbi:hypothetical protein Q7P37_006193 [Cladosporium fusiforme]